MSRFNVGAALSGLVFIVTGVMFLLDEVGTIVLRAEIVLPMVVIALGVAAVLGAVARRPRA
ncbi:MAG: hypothetical protein AB7G21_10195 [Dehalococcoidia bacterium]